MFVSAILINHECLALAWLLSCQRQNGQNGVGLVFPSHHQSVQGEMWRSSSSNSFQRTFISGCTMLTFMDPILQKHPVNINRLKTILGWELFVSIWSIMKLFEKCSQSPPRRQGRRVREHGQRNVRLVVQQLLVVQHDGQSIASLQRELRRAGWFGGPRRRCNAYLRCHQRGGPLDHPQHLACKQSPSAR